MGKLGINRKKSRLLTLLFAFLFPGAGHMYAGQHPKGLLLIAAFLLDLIAIIRLADSDGGRHLLLIVYLGIMLPIFYFISVFDSLQSLETEDAGSVVLSLTHGILILLAGSIMLLLLKPPDVILPWMNELAELSVGPIVMLASIILLLRQRKGPVSMFKLGRFTAATLVLIVGALLLLDQLQGRNDISLLGQWWPVLFIILGIEVILFSIKFKGTEKKLRLDVSGIMIALVIAITAYVVTQYADIPFRWLDQFNVDISSKADYGEEKGFRYDKTIIKVPLGDAVSLIKITNHNGQVNVRSGDVQEIEIQTTLWVDLADKTEADAIAEQSSVKVIPGEELTIDAKGQAFGTSGNKKPRMNITVTVPLALSDQMFIDEAPIETPLQESEMAEPNTSSQENLGEDSPIDEGLQTSTESTNTLEVQELDTMPDQEIEPEQKIAVKMKVESENGSIEIKELALPGGLDIRSTNGLITISNIIGPVSVKGNNGGIHVVSVNGDSNFEIKNGTITASAVQGNLYAKTLNGSLEMEQIDGDIEAETKNGKIKIVGAGASVKADTLNGGIELKSSKVGGDWDLDSSIGEVKLAIPENGDFKLHGSVTFGTITTELPFEISKKTIRGTMGEGIYRIQINATNSIVIKRFGLS
ncbi:DUF4097 and DUF4098 domain-containing protein YvlB [Paenibacillus castaneae]|uniref:LiaI-LiaF-like domain-containing protein n=1 Tax=Paenibacillus castaneae TaxID=474957 RepID=UPI000C9B411F|nr:DUF5668 domain-containing protein [Paenibacillus castaneae]NIK80496.1 DUF4097 and DUF4098 domain-containing protein YvlB [Paenibacillus castaneae]